MAISTPVSLASVFNTAPSDDTPVTASVTFTAGRLYLFTFEIDRATPPDLSTGYTFTHGATDRTASWNFIRTQLFGTPRAMAVYWYVPAVTETVALTYNAPGTGANGHAYSLVEIASGFNSTTPIVQSNGANATGAGSVSVTLGAAPTTGNLLMAFVGSRAASGAINPRTNWTELSEVVGTGTTGASGGLQVQYVFDPNLETTASATPASGTRTWGIIALEIAAAASDRRARVYFAEMEVPNAPRQARVYFAEMEVPTAPRRARVYFAEMEVPTAPRRARVYFAELEVPGAPRRARIYFAELEVPDVGAAAPRRASGYRRILYDPEGAQREIDARPDWSPDDLPLEAKPLPGLEPLPERPEPTPEIRIPKKPQVEATVVIVDDEDEIDFILNVVLDLD